MGRMTLGTLFSGFGGVEIGAMAADMTPIWAVEYDADIAAVYRQNVGDHMRVGDVLDMNPTSFETPDILHASTQCTEFSQAKAGAVETKNDISLARKVADFVTELLPPFFTLENVYMYRLSQSWQIIAQALLTHGYQFNYWHVNMADYGVPQTRRRMIVIARRDGIRPQLPPQTHAENPQPALFGGLRRWVSWYGAIEDLIPGLPRGELAPFQRRIALPYNECMIDGYNGRTEDGQATYVPKHAPAFTINAAGKGRNRYVLESGIYLDTPKCAARHQSFPDWYQLPEHRGTAARGIGNAVPPLFYQRLAEWIVFCRQERRAVAG